MSASLRPSTAYELYGVVAGVRRRWRWARVLRGAAMAAFALLVVLIGVALMLSAANFSPDAVIAARVAIVVLLAALIIALVVRPLLPKPHDTQVALYVEEHEPSLDGALVSAMELPRGEHDAAPTTIAGRLRSSALDGIRAVGDGRRVDAAALWRYGLLVVAPLIAFAIALTWGPDRFRQGMSALLPWRSAEAANPYRLDVSPGNATVARGASVIVTARAVGFQAEGAELLARTSDTSAWIRIPMTVDSTKLHSARLLDLSAATEYVVETSGLRSRIYRLAIAELPYTKRIDLDYHYPSYTGLADQHVDSSGDIAALAGSRVRVRVTPTLPTRGGRIVLDNGDTLSLTPAKDGTLSAELRVAKPGFYRVELAGAHGDLLTASLQYAIDVLPDRPPTVQFLKPGRDSRVLSVDEVYSEARASDDYGVARLDLVYSVNGAEEKTVPLHGGETAKALRDLAAGYTFMLEEYSLRPGDLVSYYARATDNDAAGGKTAMSDMYFLQVRPYAQEYRQQQGGGGGGGGGGDAQGRLSQTQREIIAGTFNAKRDSAATDRKTVEENIATLRLSQQRLREEVEQLATRLVARGVAATDSNMAQIAKILPLAAAEMDSAEKKLAAGRLQDAIAPEQRALLQLQRADAVFRNVQIAMGGEGGGGGGGGSRAEDLADLFELQREKMRNQYETLQRANEQEQNANREVDATAERLKQLSARQQQENERARRKADSLSRMGASGASGGDSQRQLAQEAEQAARQLQRLARERQSPSLAEAAQQLNDAADAMRKSAASGGQRAAADAAAALQKLREASRLLDKERDNQSQRAIDGAAETGRRLSDEQKRVSADVDRQSSTTGAERDALQRDLAARKGAMADTARELARRLENLSTERRRGQPELARNLEAALDTLRGKRVEDRLRLTQARVRDFPVEYQKALERAITADIDNVNRQLQEAQTAAGKTKAGDTDRRNAEAVERARDLARGMESLDSRARQNSGQTPGQQSGQSAGQQSGQSAGQNGQNSGQNGGQQGGQTGQGGGQQRGTAGGDGGQGNSGFSRGQMTRELRQRIADARALRRELAGRGVDASQLDRAITQMEQLAGSMSDAQAERELRGQVVEGLKAFEFMLSRSLGQKSGNVLVDRSGEVPPEYRKYVEEYYRSLGRAKPK